MSGSIFISYSRKDRAQVDELTQLLKKSNFTHIWYDQQLTGGVHWWSSILQQIRDADVVLLAVSSHSINSPACQREYRYALALHKVVIPLRIEASYNASQLPADLQALNMVDFLKADLLPVIAAI
ncbi:MAG: toll/interleukin-1 receptor domain-containing protein, partial [Mariprofundaceae bacterium]|nr:toll/interleukin-1 receptor domain-containing protein [Mariprofundaceae bacterium]